MPYRVDLPAPTAGTAERLIELGALDVEPAPDGSLAAVLPDRVTLADVTNALGRQHVSVSAAVGRDAGSVWVIRPPTLRIGDHALVLLDSPAFGTGLHPTTALCLDAVQDAVDISRPQRLLDVGTGSGVLALAALLLGVPRALAIDVEADAVRTAAENARLNGLAGRLELALGGPESLTGAWPLVVANVLAAPLIEMAPALVRRVGRHGGLVLSGIPEGVQADVVRAYTRLGLHCVRVTSRGGWVALTLRAGW
jgi:ribosomal protein L11 methyltransferase